MACGHRHFPPCKVFRVDAAARNWRSVSHIYNYIYTTCGYCNKPLTRLWAGKIKQYPNNLNRVCSVNK